MKPNCELSFSGKVLKFEVVDITPPSPDRSYPNPIPGNAFVVIRTGFIAFLSRKRLQQWLCSGPNIICVKIQMGEFFAYKTDYLFCGLKKLGVFRWELELKPCGEVKEEVA